MANDKERAVDLAVEQIERQFGKGSLMRLGEMAARQDIGVISTGSLSLDMALGVGGIPRGRVTEIYGSESSGKTTLAQHIIAEAQKAGGTAAFENIGQIMEHRGDRSECTRCENIVCIGHGHNVAC